MSAPPNAPNRRPAGLSPRLQLLAQLHREDRTAAIEQANQNRQGLLDAERERRQDSARILIAIAQVAQAEVSRGARVAQVGGDDEEQEIANQSLSAIAQLAQAEVGAQLAQAEACQAQVGRDDEEENKDQEED